MKHLISPLDLSVEELDQLLDLAQDIEANPKKYAHACDGKKLATLFYELHTNSSNALLGLEYNPAENNSIIRWLIETSISSIFSPIVSKFIS